MLTRLEIDGFKSYEGLAIDLLPFTVVLGTNAAGKSNLFDAIELLSNLATKDVAEAVKDMRGEPLELFRHTERGRSQRIVLAAEVLVDPVVRDPWGSEVRLTHTRIRYEVTLERRTLRPGVERIQVAHEAAYPIANENDRWTRAIEPNAAFRKAHLSYARTKPWLTTDALDVGLSFNVHQDGRQGRKYRPAGAAEATVLYSITNAEFPHLFALREEMRHWRLLHLEPAVLRRPVPATASDVLRADGSNLAAVLTQLKLETSSPERPLGVLSDIAVDLNNFVSGVVRLDAQLHEASREYRIELTMRDGLPFSARVASDGTLRILALLTLLHDPRHRGLVCFEEPENGVHPGGIRPLVQRLRDLVSMPSQWEEEDSAPLSQLLLNSHSPVVLSALVDHDLQATDGAILFADTGTVSDPATQEVRRKTRLRPVQSVQGNLFDDQNVPQGVVARSEVRKVLDTVAFEG
jgi:predicted ATPase